MEKVLSKIGTIKDLEEIIDSLSNFTGIIRIGNGYLFYINSELIASKLGNKDKDLRDILISLPEKFIIELYIGDSHEVKKAIKCFRDDKIFIETTKLCIVHKDYLELNNYNEIFKYLTYFNKVTFYPKKFKDAEAIVIYKNKEEIFSIFKNKKIYYGEKAIKKLKSLFAISKVVAKVEKTSLDEFENLRNTYPEGEIIRSFNKILETIKSNKKYIEACGTLSDALLHGTCLIEIGSEGYIIAKEGKPVYAFYKDYDGDKSYRIIKSMCIMEDIKYKIYKLSNSEYNLFKQFKNNRIKL
ncbi:hypothetical protein J422_03533 [Methanocaldococcus villosus KIN24-T80]|uniref:Uncharacterized protein n=1 Tax=Methanocaldococcus villosus KIN24-T80 TaxID=1069083 RepID=N6UUZ8_9EURY|nr:hypothetical protein [Methanocaldococcus villosus]ENN96189.1 hypothetical protein J422_03533 [Methanocaldococcus villosus KIN24-T80]